MLQLGTLCSSAHCVQAHTLRKQTLCASAHFAQAHTLFASERGVQVNTLPEIQFFAERYSIQY